MLRAPLSRIHTHNHQRWMSQYYSQPPTQGSPVQRDWSPFEQFSTRLNWLLRHGAAPPVIIRPDGFVRLADVRRHWQFRHLSTNDFDALLAQDEGKRFKIVQDYDVRVEAEASWIRSRINHTLKTVDRSAQRIRSPDQLPMAVYPLDARRWPYVKKHGIPPFSPDNLIHLRPAMDFSSPIHILLDVPLLLSSGIHLFRTSRGAILTTGDVNGWLQPRMFLEVLRVEVKKEVLALGVEEEDPMDYSRVAIDSPRVDEASTVEPGPVTATPARREEDLPHLKTLSPVRSRRRFDPKEYLTPPLNSIK
ncbi:hypothetical protein C8R46DRAFT_116253 [Mycena filopes]|nr:hypothetical protein C8R46DRAFT_116253 [Mycena filopes]